MRLLLIIIALFIPQALFAADVSLYVQNDTVSVGDLVSIDMRVTSFDRVNAVVGQLDFDDELFAVVEINDGGSVVPLWVKRPLEREYGTVSFSGIVPGGFIGADQVIFTVVLRALRAGDSALTLRDLRVLLHDGFGTDAPVVVDNTVLSVHDSVTVNPSFDQSVSDITPPEYFRPHLFTHGDVHGGRISIAFQAQDKGVGVDAYYVKEYGRLWQKHFVRWRYAESPYVLLDQSQQSYIAVMAVDKQGNKRVVYMEPENKRPNSVWLLAAFCSALVCVGILLYLVYGRKRSLLSHF